ncbi:MAG: glycosyltransferase family A protein [Alphaproteobacteria bacterium]
MIKKTSSKKPVVSVIIPNFNHGNFIAMAIESILKQTFQNFELIIIDDGSTDNSLSVIKQYMKQDKRIRLYQQTNQGEAAARNRGLGLARGEYIAWQDADDVSHKTRLAYQLNEFFKHKNLGGVGGWLQAIDGDGKKIAPPEKSAKYRPQKYLNIKYLIDGGKYRYGALPSFMVQKKMIKHKFRNLQIGTDMDFIFRLEEVAPITNLQKLLYYYRSHGNNSQQRLAKKTSYYGKRLTMTLGHLVFFLSAYARRLYGRDPIGHLPTHQPLERMRYLFYFIPYLRIYRFVPRIMYINKMSWIEFLARLVWHSIIKKNKS